MLQNIVSMKDTIILVLILPRYWMVYHEKYAQNDVTQVKLFIMTVKSLLEVQNTNNSEFECWMLLNIILSDFQQYRTLQAKFIKFLSLLKNVKIKDTSFWLRTDDTNFSGLYWKQYGPWLDCS